MKEDTRQYLMFICVMGIIIILLGVAVYSMAKKDLKEADEECKQVDAQRMKGSFLCLKEIDGIWIQGRAVEVNGEMVFVKK